MDHVRIRYPDEIAMPSEPIVVEGPNATKTAQMVQLCQTLRDMILSRHLADQEGSEGLVIVEHLKEGKYVVS